MPKGNPPLRLQPAIYDAWLAENPKVVDGGPIQLVQVQNSTDPNQALFVMHHVQTSELPQRYANKLTIWGVSNNFEGFKVYVTPLGYDYALMAHHRHQSGIYEDQNGTKRNGDPHFHELDLYKNDKDGRPMTRHIWVAGLTKGMPVGDFLGIFLDYYDFEDGRVGAVATPKLQKSRQGKII